MPIFIWEGESKDGRARGEMEAPGRAAVISRLREKGVLATPADVREKNSPRAAGVFASPFLRRVSEILKTEIHTGPVSQSAVCSFTRKFSVMVGAGIDISRALDVLAAQEPDARLKKIIAGAASSVRRGTALSAALGGYPEAFSPLYTGLVKAAETGGNLGEIMMKFAASLESSEQLRKKMRAAMIYPAVVVLTSVAVLFLALSFLVPVFASVFEEMGAPLPALTQGVMNFSKSVSENLIALAVFTSAAVAVPFVLYRRSSAAAVFIDRLIFFAPILGALIHKSILSRFCATLSSLLRGGVPLVRALEVVSSSSGNRFFSLAVLSVAHEMVRGKAVAESFSAGGRVFPPVFLSMIEAGEQSGRLPQILDGLAESYGQEADSLSLAVQSSVESAAIVIVGVAVSVIVISMYLPIFSLASLFSG